MKRKINYWLGAVLFAGVFFAPMVSATLITYDFTGIAPTNGTLAQPYRQTQSGLTVRVTAQGGPLHQNTNRGLGVAGNPDGNRVGNGESLTFDFSPTSVTLIDGIVFERNGGNSASFDLYGDGAFLRTFTFAASGGGSSQFIALNFGGFNFAAKTFSFLGSPNPNQGFRIASISVRVPEPATLALLGIGLLGFSLRKRQQRNEEPRCIIA